MKDMGAGPEMYSIDIKIVLTGKCKKKQVLQFRYLARDAVTLAGLLMPSCVERSLKPNW